MQNKKNILFLMLAILFISMLPLQSETMDEPIKFQERPYNLQLYTRDESDSAAIDFRGKVVQAGFDSIIVSVFKNGIESKKLKTELIYAGGEALFDLTIKIHAELSEHTFVVELISGTANNQVLTVENIVCGDAFILSGQSNSHRALSEATYQNEYCRTFGVKTTNSNYDPYLPADTLWALSQGSSYSGPGVGVLGLYIQKYILEEFQIPTCLINGGTGGSVIAEHLPEGTNRMDLNTIYGKLLYRVRKGGIGKIKGIIWHQGENDSDGENTIAYPQRFLQLYNSWKTDYNPDKVYLFQIHPGGGGNTQGAFREMQRTLADSLHLPNLSVMSTVGLPGHDGLHYNFDGYRTMAEWIYNLIRVDFYESTDTLEIYPPDIKKIVYNQEKREIALVFKNTKALLWPADQMEHKMKDYFYFDGDYGVVESGRANMDSVILQLNGAHFFDYLTYLPNSLYNTVQSSYNGPWLKNTRGIGALSFYQYPIENPNSTIKVISPNGAEIWSPGSEQTIQWTSANINTVKIEYSPNNGADWFLVAGDVNSNQNSYIWTTPEITSTECKIRISDMADSIIADESNNVFGIYEKMITVLAPNGGEIWLVDSTYTITWTSVLVENVGIKYSIDNGNSWKTVKHRVTAGDGQFEWIIPNNPSSSCKIKGNSN